MTLNIYYHYYDCNSDYYRTNNSGYTNKLDRLWFTKCYVTMDQCVTSSPNPLHTGEQQTVTKSGYVDQVYTNITVEYQQFWLLGKHWFKFLDFKTSACAEHPVICDTKPKQIFTESALHPKLNKLTPHRYVSF